MVTKRSRFDTLNKKYTILPPTMKGKYSRFMSLKIILSMIVISLLIMPTYCYVGSHDLKCTWKIEIESWWKQDDCFRRLANLVILPEGYLIIEKEIGYYYYKMAGGGYTKLQLSNIHLIKVNNETGKEWEIKLPFDKVDDNLVEVRNPKVIVQDDGTFIVRWEEKRMSLDPQKYENLFQLHYPGGVIEYSYTTKRFMSRISKDGNVLWKRGEISIEGDPKGSYHVSARSTYYGEDYILTLMVAGWMPNPENYDSYIDYIKDLKEKGDTEIWLIKINLDGDLIEKRKVMELSTKKEMIEGDLSKVLASDDSFVMVTEGEETRRSPENWTGYPVVVQEKTYKWYRVYMYTYNGEKLWETERIYDMFRKIVRYKDNYILIGNNMIIKVDKDGNLLWKKKTGLDRIVCHCIRDNRCVFLGKKFTTKRNEATFSLYILDIDEKNNSSFTKKVGKKDNYRFVIFNETLPFKDPTFNLHSLGECCILTVKKEKIPVDEENITGHTYPFYIYSLGEDLLPRWKVNLTDVLVRDDEWLSENDFVVLGRKSKDKVFIGRYTLIVNKDTDQEDKEALLLDEESNEDGNNGETEPMGDNSERIIPGYEICAFLFSVFLVALVKRGITHRLDCRRPETIFDDGRKVRRQRR